MAKYLVSHPRLIWTFPRKEPPRGIDAVADSKWAGCLTTRKPTSSCMLKRGLHAISTSSTTHDVISHSEPEAEFSAATNAASRLSVCVLL